MTGGLYMSTSPRTSFGMQSSPLRETHQRRLSLKREIGESENRRIGETENRRIGEPGNRRIRESGNREIGKSGNREIEEWKWENAGEMEERGIFKMENLKSGNR